MLTFVPTPIGNLEDISFRSLRALKDAELILCEDTRITKKLIHLLNEQIQADISLDKQFLSLHSHNEEQFLKEEYKEIFLNKNVVYVSDAGMPCVSDPGAKLVAFAQQENIPYDVLPGANALLTAYVMSGMNTKEFSFYGFLPHKTQNRKNELSKILINPYITILYESPHRIEQLAQELSVMAGQREVFVVKELTKMHQKYFKGMASFLPEKIKELDSRGEWVVIIDKTQWSNGEPITIEDIENLSLKPKEKAKLLSKLTGESVKEIYNSL
jgi:16S rRNA (cytidine1402-2'-O)-methyltransferase